MTKPRIYLSSPHIGPDELPLVQEAFATNWIAPLGPHVDKFESEFVECLRGQTTEDRGRMSADKSRKVEGGGQTTEGGRQTTGSGALHAAALSSGTAALHLALRVAGVQRGDEVFVSTLTFSASVNPILYEGARPVFIDSDRTSWNMDPARLAEALEDRARKGQLPKAVIVVHLYGQSADLDAIAGLCERYGVLLIEDAAEALGAWYYGGRRTEGGRQRTDDRGRKAEDGGRTSAFGHQSSGRRAVAPGTVGRMGIFSFNGNKIITTSGGGMLVSADKALIEKARFLATQARDPAPHYQHSEIGFNYRLSNVLAAIGRGQLRVLEQRVNARRANCAFYQEAFANLPGIEFMPEAAFGRANRWLTCITIDPAKFGCDREAVREALAAENIEARPVWKPMHRQPVFAGYDVFGGEVADDLFARGLCLPSGSNLTREDLQRVVAVVQRMAR